MRACKLKTRRFQRKQLTITESPDDQLYIRFGLCCMNTELKKSDIYCSRTLTRSKFTVERAMSIAEQNLQDLKRMLRWNPKNHIYHMRLSSDLFPHFTDAETTPYSINSFSDILADIGRIVNCTRQRVTMHPAQFNQIGAQSSAVFESTVSDLSHHANILDMMHLRPSIDNDAVLCIHGGGTYGDKEATIRRWTEQFDDLPTNVKRRIAIENCEKQYNVEDCLYIAEECNIPVIFDIHHHNCYNTYHKINLDANDYIPYIIDSWKDRRVLCHISDQKDGARLGAHHDYVQSIPAFFFNMLDSYNVGVDIEIEAKAKEQAIFKLYDTHRDLLGSKIKY